MSEETLFEHTGGVEGLHRLEGHFYSSVLADPLLQPLFGAGKPDHVDHLTWFIAESFGGPDRFTREVGFRHRHDNGEWAPVPSRVVANWPAGHFAENVAVAGDGTVFISLHSHNRIDRFRPDAGELDEFCRLPAPATGLAFDAAGMLWVTGGEVGRTPARMGSSFTRAGCGSPSQTGTRSSAEIALIAAAVAAAAVASPGPAKARCGGAVRRGRRAGIRAPRRGSPSPARAASGWPRRPPESGRGRT